MSEEPTFTIRAGEPGAAKALRQMAASIRVTNPARADEIDKAAAAFDKHNASRARPGVGYTPHR